MKLNQPVKLQNASSVPFDMSMSDRQSYVLSFFTQILAISRLAIDFGSRLTVTLFLFRISVSVSEEITSRSSLTVHSYSAQVLIEPHCNC